MDVHDHAGRQARQDAVEQQVDVAARHQDVAGIDEQHVAAAQPVEQLERRRLHGRGHDLHARQAGDVGARRGIDREDLAQRRPAPWPARASNGPSRPRSDAAACARASARRQRRHRARGTTPGRAGCACPASVAAWPSTRSSTASKSPALPLEQRLDRRIGRLRAGRRQQRRIAVRDEPAARRQAEHGRQAERQPAPASAQAECRPHDAIINGATLTG